MIHYNIGSVMRQLKNYFYKTKNYRLNVLTFAVTPNLTWIADNSYNNSQEIGNLYSYSVIITTK